MKKQKLPKLSRGAWFYKIRGSYLPATWQAWLLYIPFTALLVWSGVYALETRATLTEAALLVFPVWIAAAVVMSWVASKKA